MTERLSAESYARRCMATRRKLEKEVAARKAAERAERRKAATAVSTTATNHANGR